MAFRATKKATPKKKEVKTTKAEAVPEEVVAPVPTFSVDDLVGSGIEDQAKEPVKIPETKSVVGQVTPEAIIEKPSSTIRPASYSGNRSYTPRYGGPARTAMQSVAGGQRFGNEGGGEGRGRYFGGGGSGGYRHASGPSGGFRHFDRPSGSGPVSFSGNVQHPYSPESFTPDINVPTETVKGILDVMPEGHGFLRPKFTPSERDVYISQSQIRRFLLRNGDMVEGQARPPKDNERYWGLLKVEKIDEAPAEEMERRPKFEDLVPVYPNKLLRLETGVLPLSTRMIDLVAPIGFGQRGLIVSPPKAGKTTILKELATGIAENYPEVHLMAALIGERPEEVTDITRTIRGEVLASNFDESPAEQTRIAEVALDRAKRLVEMGKDVVILLDSITRLARAYNLVVNPSGRTLSGGFDPAALYPAKKFLGAARCVEPVAPLNIPAVTEKKPEEADEVKAKEEKKEKKTADRVTVGGSLTVIGTALIDTGSRMDDLIYEEFKGTGNMELTLSRVLQERRVFPAIDVAKSGTRHDELLLGEDAMKKVGTLRHMLSLLSEEERTVMLIDRLGKTKTNDEFLDSLSKG